MPWSVSRRDFLAAAAAAIPLARPIRAQQQQETGGSNETTFSTDVKVVNVFATVHDKSGKVVSILGKDDFDLAEDGRPQKILYFSRDTDLPLTLGLLVDTSLSQRDVLSDERRSSYRFLETVLREDRDHAFVIHFDREVELLQDLTASRDKLERALDQLELPQRQQRGGYPGQGGGSAPGQGGGGYPRRGQGGPGTTLYDAILLASDDLMKKQQGRKAIILLTDGVDNGSKVPLSEAIEAAQRADTLVYSILFAGEEGYGQPFGMGVPGMGRRGGMGRYPSPQQSQRPDGKKVLQRISMETGGGFFEVSKKDSIDQIYDRIQEELRSQYSIGYTSDNAAGGTGFRRIAVTVKQKGMVVQTREGYYPARQAGRSS
jgi:VWFA-related protein